MNVALVLGGYVNGYSIIRELSDCGVEDIWLFDYGKSLSRYSNRLKGVSAFEGKSASLKEKLMDLHKTYSYIVIYPTDDMQLELLNEIYDEISDFCFLPFNTKNLVKSLDKYIQYEYCEKYSIPYPKTKELCTNKDLDGVENLLFPLLLKPNTRKDATTSVFRSLFLNDKNEFQKKKHLIANYLDKGFTFLASEFIPGDDTNIYAYTGYRSRNGNILNEWTGKKLTQFPDKFGIFSSASNEAPEIIKQQGRELLNHMNLFGIAEPEFKYDERDGQYKLMEINLRSMMWHRLGYLSGVQLQYTQWCDATDQEAVKNNQVVEQSIHLIYMKHEVANLLTRKGYFKYFKYNVWGSEKRYFSIFNIKDLKPFFFDLLTASRSIVSICLKVYFKKSG